MTITTKARAKLDAAIAEADGKTAQRRRPDSLPGGTMHDIEITDTPAHDMPERASVSIRFRHSQQYASVERLTLEDAQMLWENLGSYLDDREARDEAGPQEAPAEWEAARA